MSQYRVTANFPGLKPAHSATQVVIGTGKNWSTALRDAALKLRQLPQLKRRRIVALNIVMVKIEESEQRGVDTDPGHQQDIRFGGTLEETGE